MGGWTGESTPKNTVLVVRIGRVTPSQSQIECTLTSSGNAAHSFYMGEDSETSRVPASTTSFPTGWHDTTACSDCPRYKGSCEKIQKPWKTRREVGALRKPQASNDSQGVVTTVGGPVPHRENFFTPPGREGDVLPTRCSTKVLLRMGLA